MYDILSKDSLNQLSRNLNEIELISEKPHKKFLILDPLIHHLFKARVEELKEELAQKNPDWSVISTNEFLSLYLSDNKDDFADEYKELTKAIKIDLEKKYPFLSVREDLSLISQSGKDILYAVRALNEEFINPNQIEEAIKKAALGVEGILQVEYRLIKGKQPQPHSTFDDLLTSVGEDIISEYGEDIFQDLEFIKNKRNPMSHPKRPIPSLDDLTKVTNRSNMYQSLFQRKLQRLFGRKEDRN